MGLAQYNLPLKVNFDGDNRYQFRKMGIIKNSIDNYFHADVSVTKLSKRDNRSGNLATNRPEYRDRNSDSPSTESMTEYLP
jgi:hypothetical protein